MKNWYFQNSVDAYILSKQYSKIIKIIAIIIRANQILKNPESSKFILAQP